jgi:hypothetical protein
MKMFFKEDARDAIIFCPREDVLDLHSHMTLIRIVTGLKTEEAAVVVHLDVKFVVDDVGPKRLVSTSVESILTIFSKKSIYNEEFSIKYLNGTSY